MTTIYLANDQLGVDSQHASWSEGPKFDHLKHTITGSRSIGIAYGGYSQSENTLYELADLFELWFASGFHDEINPDIVTDKIRKIVDDGKVFGLARNKSRVIMFTWSKDTGMNFEFRPDGVCYGTGGEMAKAIYHVQKLRNEFSMEECMAKATLADPMSANQYFVIKGHKLNLLEDLTFEQIRERVDYNGFKGVLKC